MKLPFELEDLALILTIAEMKGMRRAAAALLVEQSVLSRRLQRLENRFGIELFVRSNGGTHPTTAGLELIAAARRIVMDAENVTRRLKGRECRRHPHLSVGTQVSPSTGIMSVVVGEAQRRAPETDITFQDGNGPNLLNRVRDGHLDVAIIASASGDWHDATLPVWSERLVAALAIGNPLAAQDVIASGDLVGERLLLPEESAGLEIANLLGTVIPDWPKLRTVMMPAALDRFLTLARIGSGIVIMLEGGTGMHLDGVAYREIQLDGRPIRIDMKACWSQTNRNPALGAFLDLLKVRYPQLRRGDGGRVAD